jgi:uncharacterized membrane protein
MCKILDPASVALPSAIAAAAAAAVADLDEVDVDAEDEKPNGKKGRRKALMATYEPGAAASPAYSVGGFRLRTDKRVQSWLKVRCETCLVAFWLNCRPRSRRCE